MKSLSFPLFKTKSPPGSPKFDLTDPKSRIVYFDFKAGAEIRKIKNYLTSNTFVAILLAKKAASKGTASKMFAEVIGREKVVHVSVGDIVRAVHQDLETKKAQETEELMTYLEKNYRGYMPLKEGVKAILGRSQDKVSVPDELMLALLKREIDKHERKALFIDGFPRTLDQVSYSLFFRDLVDYRDDPDFFILIDVPERVIDRRLKYRVVCPQCQNSRNLKLLATKKVGYDSKSKEFYLVCDSSQCSGARMVAKEGDELGIGAYRERMKKDEQLMRQALSLYGIPKILLRNAVPVEKAKEYVDDYEITPEYVYRWNKSKKRVEVEEKPWVVKDDEGVPSYSLMIQPVVVSLIKQLADLL